MCRHALVAIGLFLITDIVAANAYHYTTGVVWSARARERQQRIERKYRIASDIYDHDLAPNSEIRAMWGGRSYKLTTNSLGFKDRGPRKIPLHPDRYRIVFIGDSFTEGIGIPYPRTFVGLVDTALSHQGTEVLNAGVASYSPIIYWRKIKYLLEEVSLDFHELIVFLDVSDVEDEAERYWLDTEQNVSAYKRRPPLTLRGAAQYFLAHHTIATNYLIRFVRDIIFPGRREDHALNLRRARWTIDDGLFEQYGKAGLTKMGFYMDKLASLLEYHGICLTIAVYPWPDQIAAGDIQSRHTEYWRDWARRHNIPFLNYFPHFIEPNNPSQNRRILRQLFLPDGDVHWNKRGHALVASVFLDFYGLKNCDSGS